MTRFAGFGIVFGVVAALLLGLVSDADAQRRRRRRQPEPPANGTLVVQSQVDGAEVLVDEATVGFTPLDPLELPLLELDVVVCYLCTGRHPVERCPAHTRHACELCAGAHLTSEHHGKAR